eukprot:1160384-Pelagomonas_calceolata.AAC.8
MWTSFCKWQDGRLLLPEGTYVSRYGCYEEEIQISSSSRLLLDVDEYAVVWQNVEVVGVASVLLVHLHKTWVAIQPAHVGVAAESSPVRQEHEGGKWFVGLEGGVRCVAQELEHGSVIMRRMAEGVATVAHRQGISVRSKDLVAVTCAKIKVVGTVKLKSVGESFRGDNTHICGERLGKIRCKNVDETALLLAVGHLNKRMSAHVHVLHVQLDHKASLALLMKYLNC